MAIEGSKLSRVFTDAAVTATPAAFPNYGGEKFTMQAAFANTQSVFIGDSANQPIELKPGDFLELEFNDSLSTLWRKATSGTQTVSIMVFV